MLEKKFAELQLENQKADSAAQLEKIVAEASFLRAQLQQTSDLQIQILSKL